MNFNDICVTFIVTPFKLKVVKSFKPVFNTNSKIMIILYICNKCFNTFE